MTALALQLPEELAVVSSQMAKRLQMTRAAFIRMAIQDEIKHVQRQFEEEAMLNAIKILAKNKAYLKESAMLEELDTPLPKEKKAWWRKS